MGTGNSYMGTGNSYMEKKFYCKECEKSFTRKENYENHKTFTCRKVPILFCEFCKKKFSSSTSRRRHERNVYCMEHREMRALREENDKLRAELEAERNKPTTIINNYGPVYDICENPDLLKLNEK